MDTGTFYSRRRIVSAALASMGLASLVGRESFAQTAAAAKKTAPAASGVWRLVVNEAVTGEANNFVLTSRYRPLTEFLDNQLQGISVTVDPIVDIKRFMSVAQAASKPELVFGKSVNQLAKLVRDNGYQPIVKRAEPYKAAFIVAKDSPIKTLADIANVKILMPDAMAATSAVALAELRQQKIAVTAGRVTHLKFQEEVAQMLKLGLGQVGVVNPTIAKKWVEDGGRVIAETQPVVNWSLLASPAVSAEQVQLIREALLGSSPEAAAILTSIGVKSWAKAETADYINLLN